MTARFGMGLAVFAPLFASLAAHAAEQGAAAEHGKPGMPQLDPTSYPSQVFWLVVTFAVLYVIMSRVALPKVHGVLAERESRITSDLAEAERLKAESDRAIAEYEAALASARAQAQATADQTRGRMNAETAAAKARVEAELGEKARGAEAAIQAAKAKAMGNVDAVALDVAGAIVAQLGSGTVSEAELRAALAATRA